MKPAGDLAAFFGGFVAGEGTFTASGRKFVFGVGLGASDAGACELLRLFFGCGSVRQRGPRRPGYDGEVTFSVRSIRELAEVVVPFMDEHLPASYKRQQYEAWRASLMDYWENKARRGRPPCAVDGCELISRAKGLCRGHYYRAFGA